MEALDYWRLCDDLSIYQAALLIAGIDPSECDDIEDWESYNRPKGYEAAKVALKGAVFSKKIKSNIRYPAELVTWGETTYNHAGSEIVHSNEPDWYATTISVESLKKWLSSRGFTTGFFFPDNQSSNAPYLDEKHPQYAPKLAIAIMAWEEVTQNTYLLKNKSPKKAIESWLENNATKFDLTKQAIEDIAKIANWNTRGGAPSTPSVVEDKKVKEAVFDVDSLDDEIPF